MVGYYATYSVLENTFTNQSNNLLFLLKSMIFYLRGTIDTKLLKLNLKLSYRNILKKKREEAIFLYKRYISRIYL